MTKSFVSLDPEPKSCDGQRIRTYMHVLDKSFVGLERIYKRVTNIICIQLGLLSTAFILLQPHESICQFSGNNFAQKRKKRKENTQAQKDGKNDYEPKYFLSSKINRQPFTIFFSLCCYQIQMEQLPQIMLSYGEGFAQKTKFRRVQKVFKYQVKEWCSQVLIRQAGYYILYYIYLEVFEKISSSSGKHNGESYVCSEHKFETDLVSVLLGVLNLRQFVF